jgi:hypothetical protein
LTTLVLSTLVTLSSLGLFLSILVHIASLLGLSIPPAAFVLQTGMFVVFIPAVLVMKSFVPKRGDIQRLKTALSAAPAWMRYMTYSFVGYAVISFTLSLFNAPSQTGSVVVKESSDWMGFYSAALTMLYSALQIHRKGIMHKCPNGHKVPFAAEYCEQCGQPIQLNESW